jgi:hypothetical protein
MSGSYSNAPCTEEGYKKKKGTKKIHNSSKSCGIFSDLNFSLNKNSNSRYKGPGVF